MEPGINILLGWFQELFNGEVVKMTIAFVIAARLHRKWVKKDVAEQVGAVTQAIDNLRQSLQTGLALHSKRLDELDGRVEDLEKKK